MTGSSQYELFEHHPTWAIVDRAIDDLVENGDLKETAPRRHIVGYLTRLLVNSAPPQMTRPKAKRKKSGTKASKATNVRANR